ncbi:hypothetical protein PAAG_11616 [Paracoccidioides lutzii Pb01]|uniref:Uncharacterized protein n=1 Tax=Paracoccidioides lutzii (strain ATCC MYA-826 / Pb01) TaxID=502779 RepID=A0A0A2V2C4_PARBA|nr:hypothetical protein PAAG_11616 [Paracoccidioides lutzii Pb01]KGQ01633.1 hypothetical protein PAAG_11616 [Paracoccidioides lutzii Pb01]
MDLKIKAEMLGVLVLRQPKHAGNGYPTSERTPLQAFILSGYLRYLSLVAGLKYRLAQMCITLLVTPVLSFVIPILLSLSSLFFLPGHHTNKRPTGSADKALSSVRDQIADHVSNARLRNSAAGQSWDECPALPSFQIPKRRRIVELTCCDTPKPTEDEQFARRYTVREKETIQVKLDENQCPFLDADISLPWEDQMEIRGCMNKFWNHIESVHSEELKAYSSGQKYCGICKVQSITFIPP